jgi:hypothetical protein
MIKTSKNFLPLSFALLAALILTIAGCSGGSSSGSGNPYPDGDQDGIADSNDTDYQGDPNIPCTTAKIYWPNDNIVVGNNGDIRWELLPKGCGLSATQNKSVKALADSGNVSTASVAKYPGQLITSIRIPCDPQFGSAKRPVNYDFSELGRALNDSQGWYKGTVSHPGPAKGCAGGDGNNGGDGGTGGGTQCSDFSGTNGGVYPNCTCSNSNHEWDGGACVTPNPGGGGSGGGNQCPTTNGAGGAYPNCKCASGFDYNPSTNKCEEVVKPGVYECDMSEEAFRKADVTISGNWAGFFSGMPPGRITIKWKTFRRSSTGQLIEDSNCISPVDRLTPPQLRVKWFPTGRTSSTEPDGPIWHGGRSNYVLQFDENEGVSPGFIPTNQSCPGVMPSNWPRYPEVNTGLCWSIGEFGGSCGSTNQGYVGTWGKRVALENRNCWCNSRDDTGLCDANGVPLE